jgi:hypothetical protein
LECFHTCGLVYLILYRYSITSSFYSQADSTSPAAAFRDDLDTFMNDLNQKSKLTSKIQKLLKSASNYKTLFYLNKLQLLNVIANNLKANTDTANSSNECVSQLVNTLEVLKTKTSTAEKPGLVDEFNIDQSIETADDYSRLHAKLLVIDNFYLIVPLVRADEALLQKYLKVVFQQICDAEPTVIDKINMSAIFDDKSMLKHVLMTLVDMLVEIADQNNAEKDLKALQKLSEIIKTEK